jgi:hypothetical protein
MEIFIGLTLMMLIGGCATTPFKAAVSQFTLRDWLYLAGIAVTASGLALTTSMFVWKLRVDAKYARYRETIAFMEKREEDMRLRWARISDPNGLTSGEIERDLYTLLGHLELVAYLVHVEAFDSELVYNFWWHYFDEPLLRSQINTLIMLHLEQDGTKYQHYLALCEKWATRIDSELGRGVVEP